jgi:hypothetical protein
MSNATVAFSMDDDEVFTYAKRIAVPYNLIM